jgi:hypothetical protein
MLALSLALSGGCVEGAAALSRVTADIVEVATAKALQEAVLLGRKHVIITAHLDLSGLSVVAPTGVTPKFNAGLLPVTTTTSITVRSCSLCSLHVVC